jgi:hypothetical protein
MLPDQLARIIKSVGAATNAVSFVAANNCLHPGFADTRIPYHDNPEWFTPRVTAGG